MATGTYATQGTQLANCVKGFEDYRGSVLTNWLTQENVIVSATDQDARRAGPKLAGVGAFRAAQSAAMDAPIVQAELVPIVRQIGRIIRAPEASLGNDDVSQIMARWRRYMIDNPDSLSPPSRVTSRQFVNGALVTPAPGYPAIVGTGTVLRLFQDADGFPLEARFAERVKWEVVADRQNGLNAGQEQILISGDPLDDLLDLYQTNKGSGGTQLTTAISADDSSNLIGNPSFSSYSGTAAAPTAIDSFDVVTGVIGYLAVDTVNYYRASNIEGTTPASLKMTPGTGNTSKIRQKFSARKQGLDLTRPYYLQVAFNASIGTATGTLTIKIGSTTITQVVDGLTGWQLAKIALDKTCYFFNFDTDDVEISISFAATNNNTLNVDDIVLAQWTPFRGHYQVYVGGATPFRLRDSGTFTDTEGTATTGVPGRIQRVVGRGFANELPTGLPSVNPAPAAPSVALAGLGAGNVDSGAHEYVATITAPTASGGLEGYVSVISNVVTTTGGNGQVTVTCPTFASLTGYTCSIYRSKHDVPGTWYLQSTGHTSGQVFTDNTADAGLTTQATFKNTSVQPQDL